MALTYRDCQSAQSVIGKIEMKMKMKFSQLGAIGKLSVFALLLVVPALAQNHLQSGPPVAAYGPAIDVSAGYSYLSSTIPSSGRVGLNGLAASGRVDFSPRWGVTADSGYAHTSNILGTGQNGFILSLLGGPVFYPWERRNTRLFVHALAGASLVDSAVPVTSTNYLHGWVARPSYALGGGVEHSVWGPFGLRVAGDYLRTSYVDSTNVVQPQNNLRVTASIVFRLKEHASR
jgi:hypothetical protein